MRLEDIIECREAAVTAELAYQEAKHIRLEAKNKDSEARVKYFESLVPEKIGEYTLKLIKMKRQIFEEMMLMPADGIYAPVESEKSVQRAIDHRPAYLRRYIDSPHIGRLLLESSYFPITGEDFDNRAYTLSYAVEAQTKDYGQCHNGLKVVELESDEVHRFRDSDIYTLGMLSEQVETLVAVAYDTGLYIHAFPPRIPNRDQIAII